MAIPGPYDRPFLNPRQQRAEARRRALQATESAEAVRRRFERERAGGQAITESFQDVLRRQMEQNTAALNAIQGGSGGAGAALTTGAITGATIRAGEVPLFAAGEGVRTQRLVNQRETDAITERNRKFRENLAIFNQQVRDEEREKQAAQIERAAAERAYGIQERDYNRRVYESDRDFSLQVAREQRLAQEDTGDVLDLVPTLNEMAKEISVKPGAGGWSGTLRFKGPDGPATLDVENVDFDPRGKSLEERQRFWWDYVERAMGYTTGTFFWAEKPNERNLVGTGGLKRDVGSRKPVDVAKELISYLRNMGYTRQEAVQAVLRTAWGAVNSKAVGAAAKG